MTPEEKMNKKRELNRIRQKRFRDEHPERAKEIQHRSYMKHREKRLTAQAAYRERRRSGSSAEDE